MSEQAIRYFRENKGKYPEAEIETRLRESGYPSEDIDASKKEAYREDEGVVTPTIRGNFWNFREKYLYERKGQKIGHFAAGFSFLWILSVLWNFFFALYLVNILGRNGEAAQIWTFGMWIIIVFGFLLSVPLYFVRRFIAYGLLFFVILWFLPYVVDILR